ncbi:MAG: cation-transporting P-type ATPase [Candidatus Tectomicrobia bacterium]|nr:cation-transporting P-type ATPase [Candidatus Tectomicrobia bacterium]
MRIDHDWYTRDIEDIWDAIETSPQGLSPHEATRRLVRFGPNRLPSPPRTRAWVQFLKQFNDPLIYVLLITAAITIALREWLDASVILGVVVANAIIGFVQESKAEHAILALQQMLTPSATVRRGGQQVVLPAEQLVPGDVVVLQGGEKVPADVRLFSTNNLQTDEASLTGESVPVAKKIEALDQETPVADRCNMAFSSTLLTTGSGLGVVVATGDMTELGRIAGMLHEVSALTTPLTRRLAHFSKVITLLILVLSALLVAGGVLMGNAVLEMFMAAVALAVSAIPEGLPAIMSITLAIGAKRMVARHAITRHLPAVETLGSTTVICTDKTGTLTRNEMTVTVVETAEGRVTLQGVGYAPTGAFIDSGGHMITPRAYPALTALLRSSFLCNDARVTQQGQQWTVEGDPTEGALIVATQKAAIDLDAERQRWPRADEIPFTSEQQYMATLHRDSDGVGLICVKGAPETVLTLCSGAWPETGHIDREVWMQKARMLASEGLRVLAVAMKAAPTDQSTLTPEDLQECAWLGLVGMIDSPREEAIRAIQKCQQAGIRVKMITGDHLDTARAIATQLGIENGKAIAGMDIDGQDEATFLNTAAEVDVFARVSPRHKLRLVQALQHQGEIVAMTGDGVNDAPALKQADIGVAMGRTGTDVAKEAADMVLVDDNFASIEQAVEEGRTVFDNLKKTILFILPTNGGECFTLIAAIALGLQLPILPLHILWINLITTVALALTLAFEPIETGVMTRAPRHPRAPLMDRPLVRRMILVSVLMAGGTFGLFFEAQARGNSIEEARTVAVNALVFCEVLYLFNTRYLDASVLNRPGLFGNRMVLLGISAVVLFQLLFTYWPVMQALFHTTPLDAAAWLRILALSIVLLLVVEAEKTCVRKGASALAQPSI